MRHKQTSQRRRQVINPAYVSLREAGRRLDRNPHYVRGVANTLRVPFEQIGRALAMSWADFERVQEEVAGHAEPIGV